MTMGEKIKYYRKQLGISQEELGQKMDPPVFKSAVSKWEKGRVENIKRSQIKQLADLFNITPLELLSYDDDNIYDLLTPESINLLKIFSELDTDGQGKLVGYAEYLLYSSKDEK